MNIKLGVRLLCSLVGLASTWSNAQSLPELIEGVLSSHPSMRSQQALGESAKQALEGAQWQFYPTPSVGFEQVDASAGDPNYPSYGDKNVTTQRLQQPPAQPATTAASPAATFTSTAVATRRVAA